MSSAAESEVAGLFINIQHVVPIYLILKDIHNHLHPYVLITLLHKEYHQVNTNEKNQNGMVWTSILNSWLKIQWLNPKRIYCNCYSCAHSQNKIQWKTQFTQLQFQLFDSLPTLTNLVYLHLTPSTGTWIEIKQREITQNNNRSNTHIISQHSK